MWWARCYKRFASAFEGRIIHTQYRIKSERLDAYFPKQKVGIEVDEYSHKGRNPKYEQSRQLMIQNYEITVTSTNPDAPVSNINRLIN